MAQTGARETIGIMGGSYNPVHVGHLMVASYLSQWGYVDRVWLTLSPQNPVKDPKSLISDRHRLDMLETAVAGIPGIDVCDIELSMPRPSYTIATLNALAERYPEKDFRLVIGSDNWLIFDRWKDSELILGRYGVIVYPRPGYPVAEGTARPGMTCVQAPVTDISGTFIRRAIADGKDMNCFVPPGVYSYITENSLYKTSDT